MKSLLGFLRRHWIYVIVPFVLVVALLITLLLSNQPSSPFIYTLF
jgi:uncharacterized protein involved in exopolysaccharide biosynthesis